MHKFWILSVLALAASGCGDRPHPGSSGPSSYGPDAVLLRVPAAGGTASAYRVGSDSALWRSRSNTPATDAILGFDDFQGLVLGSDSEGKVFGVDLRLGTVSRFGSEQLQGKLISEGASVFGFDPGGRILRLTQVATWSWGPPSGVDELLPTPDGSLLLVSAAAGRTIIRRIIPPDTRVLDSTYLPRVRQVHNTTLGDRIWFDTDSGLIALRARELTRAATLRVRDSIVAMAATPSGDRVFLATIRANLRIVDRFAESERGGVDLPQRASALRMDPDGRYLLARSYTGDSIYVVSIGTLRVVSALAGVWRNDLPFVTPDGGVLLTRGEDAVLVDAETGRERLRYDGGGSDRWHLVRWNGFRPRAAGLDIPVEFEEYAVDSAAADSALAALMASRYGAFTSVPRASDVAPPLPGVQPQHPRGEGNDLRETWTVSFATMLAEDRATEMADRIRVDGRAARVISGSRDGIPIWRVVLGPYDTREEAERSGMRSGLPYWVFEGVP